MNSFPIKITFFAERKYYKLIVSKVKELITKLDKTFQKKTF